MKQVLVVGIGAGHPDHITLQAVKALQRADVFFLMDKGDAKKGLNQVRQALIEQHAGERRYRVVEAANPERQRDGIEYRSAVDALNAEKQCTFERLIREELADGQCGAFLVWGDPALYDSTLRILRAILDSGRLAFDYEVIPGISSVQALAARHKVPLNEIGQPVSFTPGRRLGPSPHNQVVMLDAENAYKTLIGEGLHIYWGAYVGLPQEVLIAGPLDEVAEDIERTRAAAREQHGWIMDAYLLTLRP